MPMQVDVQLSQSVMEAARRAPELQALGVDGVFSFENSHDLFFPLVAAAPVCDLDLMTNVAIAFPRSPWHLANSAYDLQELSGGRFRLGLGTQVKAHVEKRFGGEFGRPVAHMREWVLAIKAILEHWQERTPLRFEGEYTRHTLSTPAFDPGPNPHGIAPILVGALGPKMNEMAAEVADGILVMPFNSGEHMTERTMPAIDRGLATAGRTRDDLEVIVEVIVGVGRNDEELEAARGCATCSRSTGRHPRTSRCSTCTAGATCSPSSTGSRSRATGRRWPRSSPTRWSTRSRCTARPDQVAEEIVRRYGPYSNHVCAYFPFYQAGDDLVADFTSALKSASA